MTELAASIVHALQGVVGSGNAVLHESRFQDNEIASKRRLYQRDREAFAGIEQVRLMRCRSQPAATAMIGYKP